MHKLCTFYLTNTNAESYNVMGSFTDVINPCSVTKDYMFMSFGFMVKKYGETTVNFNVVDMTIRIDGEDYISIENSVKKLFVHIKQLKRPRAIQPPVPKPD